MSAADARDDAWIDAISGARRRLIPHMDDLQDAVFRLLPEPRVGEPYQVLDIGTATGLLLERLLDANPDAHVHVVHSAAANLDATRRRLERFGDQVSCQLGDYTRMNFDGPYDVAIAELEASFLENKSKRTLLSAAYAALRRGGRVICVIQTRGPTGRLEEVYSREWDRMVDALGATEEDRNAAVIMSSKERTATLAQQLEWMSGDGFENVDCFVKFWRFAVVAGDKL